MTPGPLHRPDPTTATTEATVTVNLNKGNTPEIRPTPLALVRGERKPLTVDLDAPVLPLVLTDGPTRKAAIRAWRRQTTHRTGRFLVQLPGILWWLGVVYPWVGAGRAIRKVAAFIYDRDTADLRHAHAGGGDSPEYVKVNRERKANLHARSLVVACLVLPVLVPVLAWTYPQALAVVAAVLVFAIVCKLIPGRGIEEVAIAAGLAVGTYVGLPHLLALIPRPPAWPFVLVGVAAWLLLGWFGRPAGRKLIRDNGLTGSGVVPLRAPMIREALCQLGIAGLRDPESIRMMNDIHRHGPGVQVDIELPGGIAASQVVERRERLAAALKRELGTVWPTGGRRHAAHLALYVGDEPMVQQVQRPWPLAKGAEVDIFRAQPQVTDQRGEWVDLTLAYAAVVIGAQPRMGKTYLLRQLLLTAGMDVRPKVYALDGKGTGDLAPCRLFAHFYSVGDDRDEVEGRVLPAFRELRQEMRRRAKLLRELPREECPESKVTSALANRRGLEPIVVGIDETQAYFGYGDKTNRAHKAVREELTAIVTDLVKRGPALGFIVLLATQNVCDETIPRQISTNAVIRAALKLFDHTANDQVLGTGAYSKGIDATSFDIEDKGLVYLYADGGVPQIVRSVAGLDAVVAERVAAVARAQREAKDRLTGEAAGEEATVEAVQVDLLADARDVMDNPAVPSMHLTELRTALTLLRPTTWGHLDNAALGSMLREAGVKVGTVWSRAAGKDGKGVKREWLNVAATADEDPDDGEDGVVIPLSNA